MPTRLETYFFFAPENSRARACHIGRRQRAMEAKRPRFTPFGAGQTETIRLRHSAFVPRQKSLLGRNGTIFRKFKYSDDLIPPETLCNYLILF